MTDIAKCAKGCRIRNRCWRWTAPAGKWQTIMDFKPDRATGECAAFWPLLKDRSPGTPSDISLLTQSPEEERSEQPDKPLQETMAKLAKKPKFGGAQ